MGTPTTTGPRIQGGRVPLNCAECRRLKLRCDRSIPCLNCKKRRCADLCPHRARETNKMNDRASLQTQVNQLQNVLRQNGLLPPEGSPSSTPPPKRSRTTPSTDNRPSGSASPSNNHDVHSEASPGFFAGIESAMRSTSQQGGSIAGLLDEILEHPSGDSSRQAHGGRTSSPNTLAVPHVRPLALAGSGSPSSCEHTSRSGGSVLSPVDQESPGVGTLVVTQSGRSKYLGPSAASEWLKDQEAPDISRDPSPGPSSANIPDGTMLCGQSGLHATASTGSLFPSDPLLCSASPGCTFTELLDALPDNDEIDVMIEAYHRHFAWMYDCVKRTTLQMIIVAARNKGLNESDPTDIQQLGLLYIVLAVGASQNLALPPGDHLGDEYCSYSKSCLALGSFAVHNTLAGVQTLCLMAHYHNGTDQGRDGDLAWPLWGLAMRIAQAMGLHRDGAKWGLPNELVDERRRVFWECHSVEIFQANCFSRPSSITPEFRDVLYPSDTSDWHRLKLDLCQISQEVLHAVISVRPVTLARIDQLNDKLIMFEQNIPFRYRCRAAVEAVASVYPDVATARQETPAVNRRGQRLVLEQHFLAMLVSETIINLYRQLFVRALAESGEDPTRTTHGRPFLVVFERNVALIQIMSSLFDILPSVAARHWWCLYHAFNAAVTMGTLMIAAPHIGLAKAALTQFDKVIAIYTQCLSIRASRRLLQNMRWLLKLRQRAITRMAIPTSQVSATQSTPDEQQHEEDELATNLLGWKTRLIERASQGNQTARTVVSSSPSSSSVDIPLAAERAIKQFVNISNGQYHQHQPAQTINPVIERSGSGTFAQGSTLPTDSWQSLFGDVSNFDLGGNITLTPGQQPDGLPQRAGVSFMDPGSGFGNIDLGDSVDDQADDLLQRFWGPTLAMQGNDSTFADFDFKNLFDGEL